MNIEEARKNIGAEVLLDGSTKPYTDADGEYGSEFSKIIEKNKTFKILDTAGENVLITQEIGNLTNDILIKAKHLKLKPQNYKIHVPTEEESREAQELFFELGYDWINCKAHIKHTDMPYIYSYNKEMGITIGWTREKFESHKNKNITLQDLRDMVAKKKGIKSMDVDLESGGEKKVEIEMTWEDALRVIVDGGDVESTEFYSLKEWLESQLSHIDSFRISPKRVKLNGEYTKEELLKKIEDM